MPLQRPGPPSRDTIESAALARVRQLLLAPGYTPEQREARLS
jgi:hypothetical protein